VLGAGVAVVAVVDRELRLVMAEALRLTLPT
jgi:hypothetical protein